MYQKIKALCKEKDISVYLLEKQLGFSTGSICKWDNSMPRADALLKVAKYFNVTIDYFIPPITTDQNGSSDMEIIAQK